MNLRHLFDSSQVDTFSKFAVRLRMGFEVDNKTTYVAFGSGFIVRDAQDRHFLITAWHNLSGRENETGELKDKKDSCIPNKVEIHGLYDKIVRNLYDGDNDPNHNNPLYWRHPAGPHIDVAALPIEKSLWERAATLDSSYLDKKINTSNAMLYVSQECFLIGFPLGLADRQQVDALIPIRKTGTLASEPALDFCEEPVFVIDATTRPGMSGCAVFVQTQGITRRMRFLGVYGGRLGSEKQDSHLGFVYKAKTINEVLDAGPNHTPPIFRNKNWGAY